MGGVISQNSQSGGVGDSRVQGHGKRRVVGDGDLEAGLGRDLARDAEDEVHAEDDADLESGALWFRY